MAAQQIRPAAQARDERAGLPPASRQRASLKQFPNRILADQKTIWTSPVGLVRHHWRPLAAVAAGTLALIALDPHDAPYFGRTHRFSAFDRVMSTRNTAIAEGVFPVVLYLDGALRHHPFERSTAIEAGEALVDTEIVAEVFKNGFRRLTPGEVRDGNYSDTWFETGGGLLIKGGSFVSGHASGAFALASVVAGRYRDHSWAPWIAYGSAGAISFSRLTLQAHFPSDVFAGGVLGTTIARFVVLPHPTAPNVPNGP
jgi:membrane-associated phospholipid phosphatase